MSTNQEEMVGALQEALGGGPSSAESLDYARRILEMYMDPAQQEEPDALGAMRTQADEVRGALEAARERIAAMKGPTRAEKLLAIGAGLGRPTRTGAIGETAGHVASYLQPVAAQQREFDEYQGKALTDLDVALAGVDAPVTQAELQLDTLRREQMGRMAQTSLKTIAKGGVGARGRGSATREAKIQDYMALYRRPRSEAVAVVDGHIDMELVPELGHVRLLDAINRKAYEIPLDSDEEIAQFMRFMPDDEQAMPRGATTVEPGEEDFRTEEERMADGLIAQRIDQGDSLWEMAGVATGPWAAARVGASYVSTLLGGKKVATATIEGRQGLKLRGRDLARAMVDNPRMPVRMIEMAIEDAAIEPSALDTPDLMQTRLVALDRELWDRYLDAVTDSNDRQLPLDVRESQRANARALQIFLRDLRVPTDRQSRRLREIPSGVPREDLDRAAEEPRSPKTAPAGVSQRDWDLMPESDRELWSE